MVFKTVTILGHDLNMCQYALVVIISYLPCLSHSMHIHITTSQIDTHTQTDETSHHDLPNTFSSLITVTNTYINQNYFYLCYICSSISCPTSSFRGDWRLQLEILTAPTFFLSAADKSFQYRGQPPRRWNCHCSHQVIVNHCRSTNRQSPFLCDLRRNKQWPTWTELSTDWVNEMLTFTSFRYTGHGFQVKKHAHKSWLTNDGPKICVESMLIPSEAMANLKFCDWPDAYEGAHRCLVHSCDSRLIPQLKDIWSVCA